MKKATYAIRHDTYAGTICALENFILDSNLMIPAEFSEFNYWSNLNYETTKSDNIQIEKNNGIVFQVYRSNNGTYELNAYLWN